jgi:hypothetical protein
MAEPLPKLIDGWREAGDRPGASRRAGLFDWSKVSESLRQVQALLEAAGLPRGRTSRDGHAQSTPATKPPPRSIDSFNPS